LFAPAPGAKFAARDRSAGCEGERKEEEERRGGKGGREEVREAKVGRKDVAGKGNGKGRGRNDKSESGE